MTEKRTLRSLIADVGSTAFAKETGFGVSYINKVKRGDVPGSLKLLARARRAYGPLVDMEATVDATLTDIDAEAGEEVDHVQP